MPLTHDVSSPSRFTPPDASKAGPARTRLVVLVHGINGSAATWDKLRHLCAGDPALADFRFETFEYATGFARLHPLRRLPTLQTIADQLGGFLALADFAHFRDVRLIGHSQGGLVIQRYVQDMLTAQRGRELDRIRQITFFATPTLGSSIFGWLRRLVFAAVSNPQESELRIFNAKVAETRRYVEEHVAKARERSATTAQIPIHVFYGAEDGVVDPGSAMGSFSSSYPIAGDHSKIIQPTNRADPRYLAFAELLRQPLGHRHVFEIDWSELSLRFEPHDLATPFMAPLPDGKTRPVMTESVAHYTRRVRFSRGNRCDDLYVMRYGTKNDGYVAATTQPKNEWPSQLRHDYEQRGLTYRYHFNPTARQPGEYAMFLKIYRGFERKHQHAHYHVAWAGESGRARFGEWRFALDLRPLLEAGWIMKRAPSLMLLDADRNHDECPENWEGAAPGALGDVIPPSAVEPGAWRWVLREIDQGIVNVLWEIEPAVTTAVVEGEENA